MTKIVYLAAMALLGLGLTMAQNTSPASDSSNSSKPAQTQSGTATPGSADSSHANRKVPARHRSQQDQEQKVPDTTVRDQQSSTTSTTGVSGENKSQPSKSTMGTTGSTPATEENRQAEPQNGPPTDQQPNSSSSPTTPAPPQMVMNSTPAARAAATHTPDPGTCMNPAAMGNGQATTGAHAPNCD